MNSDNITAKEMDTLLKCLDKGAEYRHATGEYSAFIGQLEEAYPTLRDYIISMDSPSFDIHDAVLHALDWCWKEYGCIGCTTQGKEEHNPCCLLRHEISCALGSKGRIVIQNPHPSVL
jgi:hypothetical protein